MKTLFKKNKKPKDSRNKVNFNLSENDFIEMVEQLKKGNEEIFEKIFLSHFSDCLNYLKVNFKTSHVEAYDITMDTLIDFRTHLVKDKLKYGNLRYLFTKMASQRLFKLKRKEATVSLTNEVIELEEKPEQDIESDLSLLKKALNTLDPKKQKLIKNFYFNNKKLKEISEDENKSHSAIRKQKERSLQELRVNFFKLKKASL